MNKKLLLIIVSILGGLLLVIGIFFYIRDKRELNSIDDLVQKYNEFIKIYDDLSDVAYIDGLNNECLKYNDDVDSVLEKLSNISIYTVGDYSLIKNSDKGLRICRPQGCKIKDIAKYDVIKVDASNRLLSIDGKEMPLAKKDGKWMFKNFDLICEKVD